jgi:AcrR family transcriptional regulator
MPLLAPVTIAVRPVMSGRWKLLREVVMSNNVVADSNDVNDYFALGWVLMSERPYHHGNLRTALIEQAERTVRERGVQDLSLRELAREIGVSHGAPHRHFADRRALLDALAEAGFSRLGAELRGAVVAAGSDFEPRLRAIAAAYVRFATEDAALLELMFAGKHRAESGALHDAAADAFAVLLELIEQGQADGALERGQPERVGLVLFATIQGIAALSTGGMIHADQLDDLVTDAIAHFLRGSRAIA